MNLWILLIACLQTGNADDLPTTSFVDGSEQRIAISTFDSTEIRVGSSDAESVRPTSDVAKIVFRKRSHRRPNAKLVRLVLIDGSVIYADKLVMSDGVAQIQSTSGWQIDLERAYIRFVELKQQASPQFQTEWDDIVKMGSLTADRLIVKRNEHLDFVEGVIGDLDDSEIAFELDGRSVNVGREKIEGFTFYHASGKDIAGETCLLRTTEQSELYVVSGGFELDDFEGTAAFAGTLACGAPISIGTDKIVELDFEIGRSIWLSSMTPSTVQWTPLVPNPSLEKYQQQLNRPRTNHAFDGSPLKLSFPGQQPSQKSFQQYDTGFAVKGGTRMVFELNGKYSRITGLFGFAPSAARDGSVAISLEGDGQTIQTWTVDNKGFIPEEIDQSVDGVDRLTLRVDYHDGRNIGDVIHFCNLKVSK